ncbi:MAG TPA: redox-sensitive transcriptional activator SoxR [Polyangia bacterium]
MKRGAGTESSSAPARALLTIGDVSRRSGVATSALRFYEERGLIASERSRTGHRRYRRDVLRRVAFIVFAQRVGLCLEEVGGALDKLPEGGCPTGRDWARLATQWTERIDQRIRELERVREAITNCIGCGCLSLEQCRMANPGDRAAELGPGPRYLMAEVCPKLAMAQAKRRG